MLVFNEEDDEELSKVYKGVSIMEEYVKEAKRASTNEEIVGLYDKELHEEKLRTTELEEARDEGEKKGIIETAKNMLKKKLDKDLIIECTGLTRTEINNLKY